MLYLQIKRKYEFSSDTMINKTIYDRNIQSSKYIFEIFITAGFFYLILGALKIINLVPYGSIM